jgi:acetylglutamate kinase
MKATNKHDALVVIKLGGNVLSAPGHLTALAGELKEIQKLGFSTVLVHGGGSLINERLKTLGIPTQKKHGLRVTDATTMSVVKQVLDEVNCDLNQRLSMRGLQIQSFDSTSDALSAEPAVVQASNGEICDLGFVGNVGKVNVEKLTGSLIAGKTPLLSSTAKDAAGQFFNINADEAAASIASALSAQVLLFLSDVPGVLCASANESSAPDSLPIIHQAQWKELLANGTINGGMIPKLETAFAAAQNGVKSVQIVDGTKPNCIISAIISPGSTGTLIAA